MESIWERIRSARLSPSPTLLGLLALCLLSLSQFIDLPVVNRIGLATFDTYQRAAPRPYDDPPVRIVDIDDESVRRLGQWPWPRDEIAELTERLASAGAAVIAYDVVFSEPDRTSPARLAERLRADGDDQAALVVGRLPDPDQTLADTIGAAPVILGYFLTYEGDTQAPPPSAGIALAGSLPSRVPTFSNAINPLPGLTVGAAGTGFVSTVGDADGIVRRAPLIARQGDQLLPSLSLEALRLAQQAGAIMVRTSDASGQRGGDGGDIVAVRVGQFEIPTSGQGEMWLHFTAPQPGRTVPAWRVLQDDMSPEELQRAFAGQIVFVGAGAIGLRDLVATPIEERTPGVGIHAQMVEQAVQGVVLMRPDWAPGLERALLLLMGLTLAVALPRLGSGWGALAAVAGVLAVYGLSWWAFRVQGFLIDPTWPTLGLAATYGTVTVATFFREERRRAFIHGAFDRYLSPEMVRRIVADPGRLELGGEEREMTVLFCDIRGFSRISEDMEPQDIIQFLIAFLTPMCDVLLARNATIDKFIGDAIVAFWNAPLDDTDQHTHAARAALEMIAALDQLNRTQPDLADTPWPEEVKIGIGLNTGLCCVGNMGAAQRLSYSLIGDTVNLASRIEGLTKVYGVPILIGSALNAALPGFATVEVDRVRVVGRKAPETLFALIGDETVAQTPDFIAFNAAQSALLGAYRSQNWRGTARRIKTLRSSATRFGLDTAHDLMTSRMTAYRKAPPHPTGTVSIAPLKSRSRSPLRPAKPYGPVDWGSSSTSSKSMGSMASSVLSGVTIPRLGSPRSVASSASPLSEIRNGPIGLCPSAGTNTA